MFNLEKAISNWRRRLRASTVLSRDVVDELEGHLRECIEAQTRQGLAAENAFELAIRQMGSPLSLKGEFSKLASAKYRSLAKMFRPSCFVAALLLIVGSAPAVWDSEISAVARGLGFSTLVAAAFYLAALPFCYRLLPNERNPRVALALKIVSMFLGLWPIFALLDATRIIGSQMDNLVGMVSWDVYVIFVWTIGAYVLRSFEDSGHSPSRDLPLSHEFTETASAVLHAAREESVRLNHGYVGTEHILLGILAGESSLIADVFRRTFVSPEMARAELEKIAQPQATPPDQPQLDFTPRANRALEFAANEAHAMGQSSISVEHLFLGLLRENEGLAGLVLRKLGVNYDIARAEIAKGFDSGDDDNLAPVIA